MSLLSKLTIIIPTYNRQSYALRAMQFWSVTDVTVHVLDGTTEAIKKKIINKIGENIHYHHLPISFVERLKYGVEILSTEYTMLHGDDEFFLPSGLKACIQQLEKDKELVSCIGRCLAFSVNNNEVKGWPSSTEMEGYNIQQDDSVERMIFHMNPYTCSTIYSVVRTPVWQIAMTPIIKKDFQIQSVQELQFELGVCYLGKSKVIETLMWLRSHENQPVRKTEPILKSFPEWWLSKANNKERDELIRITGEIFANGDSYKIDQACDGVEKALDAYVAQYYTDLSIEEKHTSIKSNIYSIILRLIPRVIKDIIKKRYYLLRTIKNTQQKKIIEAARDLNNCGVNVDFKQLTQIINLIYNFHANEGGER